MLGTRQQYTLPGLHWIRTYTPSAALHSTQRTFNRLFPTAQISQPEVVQIAHEKLILHRYKGKQFVTN